MAYGQKSTVNEHTHSQGAAWFVVQLQAPEAWCVPGFQVLTPDAKQRQPLSLGGEAEPYGVNWGSVETLGGEDLDGDDGAICCNAIVWIRPKAMR